MAEFIKTSVFPPTKHQILGANRGGRTTVENAEPQQLGQDRDDGCHQTQHRLIMPDSLLGSSREILECARRELLRTTVVVRNSKAKVLSCVRKQLAGFVEWGIKPKRVYFATRVSLTLFTRLFDWREAVAIVRPPPWFAGTEWAGESMTLEEQAGPTNHFAGTPEADP
jgi:hypothetical protein